MAGDRPATRSAACLQKVARAFQHTHRENARSRECVREGKQICHLLRIFLCLFLSVSICLCLSLCLFLSLSLLTHYISHRQGKYEHLPRHGRRLGGCPRHRPHGTLRPAPPAPRQVTVLPSSPCPPPATAASISPPPSRLPPSTAPLPPQPSRHRRPPQPPSPPSRHRLRPPTATAARVRPKVGERRKRTGARSQIGGCRPERQGRSRLGGRGRRRPGIL